MTPTQKHFITILAMVTLPIWVIPMILVGLFGVMVYTLYGLVYDLIGEIDRRRSWRR